jgi:hypothetical protein
MRKATLWFHSSGTIHLLRIAGVIGSMFALAAIFAGCGSISTTSTAKGEAIAGPIVSGAAFLVLRNNPADIASVEAISDALAAGNLGTLTTAGLDAAVIVAAKKTTLSAATETAIELALNTGLGAYLATLGEADLTSDPNAAAVVTFLANQINAGAQAAAANQK